MKQSLLLAFILVFGVSETFAQYHCKSTHHHHAKSIRDAANSIDLDPRVDSLAIIHYHINIEFPPSVQAIIANTEVTFQTKVSGVQSVTLDLESLTVDSVIYNGQNLNFTHVNGKLHIPLSNPLSIGTEFAVNVYYRGAPQQDPTGFGGFYWLQGYAFNLGVSLTDIPHPYGRAWFPCFDNFITRSTYTLTVKTHGNQTSVCGGLLVEEILENNQMIRRWEIYQPIPTYLVSIAVGPYVFVETTYQSISGEAIPVMLAAAASDTTNMKSSFSNLEAYFHRMEENFGPYLWDRVGYVLVPFNSGAMEHAMNIAFPRIAANGQLTFQGVMAHEMAHNWFGNLATCRVAEEMYLNEGFAVYGEFLFNEWLQGQEAYRTAVRNNHRSMLRFAHVKDEGYWPLSNVPQEYTYGDHSYRKGADIIHTLRTYMGDEPFFEGLRYFLENNIYKDVTSDTLQHYLELSSGQNLSDFFDYWIHQKGWTHFGIDSMQVTPSGNQFNVRVFYQQKLVAGENYFQNVPMQLSFLRDDFSVNNSQVMLSGQFGTLEVTVPFQPVHAFFNRDEKISMAVTADERVFRSTASQNLSNALFEIYPSVVTDSTYLRIEHNFVGPDGEVEGNFRISQNRYWTVKGLTRGNFNARMRVYYDGRTSATNSGWLDHELIDVPDNQVILLHRAHPGDIWRRMAATTNTTFPNNTDKYGFIELVNFPFGEYVLAVSDSVLSTSQIMSEQVADFTVFPNPASDFVQIQLENFKQPMHLSVIDLSGKEIHSEMMNQSLIQMNTKGMKPGVYFIRLSNPATGENSQQKLIIR
ncbi:MAG: M1 family aminopeptidase [Flavobacteriales bacterium]